ncbi:unnamed protein product [Acanthoscelides obtectus]|uniref:Uncharacterized protein n=1 Tax=Acanthoscelides obtectus TaxID=200917 RepID=A0A9P0PSF0_ACAOB|nr:unnamed protein product [Acanthoscelides obtectus]CAH2015578.1 unnamed protein product [Acanthoscelides obtectus]CAK1620838.1 Jerky protein homolog-like [Acanthoscelides obtectus]CAK1673051.1 Jerky protein homolog-like [Acanthoscelides obtectus]
MASKRKRVVLSLADKLKIIEQLDKGVTGKKLSEIYGVGQATICDIKNSKSTLLNFVSVLENEDGSSSRKTMKTATNKNLEDAVFKWFLQQRSMGNPISGPILCEKAKILAEKLGYSSFKASNGWLRNFKFRHGVRELDLAGEKLSADSAAAENFIEKFKTAAESYDPEFDCCYMVAEAWSLVTAVTLRRAWNKLKGLPSEKNKKKESEENEKQENGEDEDDEDALSLEEIRKMIVKIPGCTEVSAEDVGEWMACDTSDPGFQILNDDEIVESVREDVEVEVGEELSADVEVDAGPSASEAFAGLETALKWMERQPECDHLQLLTVKRMRDLAARKRMKNAKQLTLTEMFKKQ